MCLCVCTTNASKKRTSEAAEQPSKRVKTVNAAAGESSRAATGSGDEVLGYHPLHDETGSQRTTRRQNDATSRAQRRRLRQVQRGVTPSQTSSQPSYHVSVGRSPESPHSPSPQPGQVAPGNGDTLSSDGAEDDEFEDDGFGEDVFVFEHMPETSRAVPERDWSLLTDVNRKFDGIQLETCNVCNERWFDMDLKTNGQCSRCDKATRRNQVNVLSAANFMDPEEFPAHLPELDDTEEMLIARCHVHVEVQRYRGAQYKYAGHAVYFMQNTGKIYNKLPRLPQELEVC
jgi:hypothetical protein